MIRTRVQVYNKKEWREVSKKLRKEVGHCERCGSKYRLQVHHVFPLQWSENDTLEFDSWSEITDVPLQVLCHTCHMGMEKKDDKVDYAKLFANEII